MSLLEQLRDGGCRVCDRKMDHVASLQCHPEGQTIQYQGSALPWRYHQCIKEWKAATGRLNYAFKQFGSVSPI
jgi:hypothetical protein